MAQVDVEIAGRRYSVGCRDGEEPHLRDVAALVDQRARDAAGALGNLSEAKLLLFTALMLADDLHELRSSSVTAASASPQPDAALATKLNEIAERLERLAGSMGADPLEQAAPTS